MLLFPLLRKGNLFSLLFDHSLLPFILILSFQYKSDFLRVAGYGSQGILEAFAVWAALRLETPTKAPHRVASTPQMEKSPEKQRLWFNQAKYFSALSSLNAFFYWALLTKILRDLSISAEICIVSRDLAYYERAAAGTQEIKILYWSLEYLWRTYSGTFS